MSKIYSILILVCLLNNNLFAQANTDLTKLEKLAVKDFGQTLLIVDSLLNKNPLNKEKGVLYRIKGKVEYFRGDFKNAVLNYNKSVELLEKENNEKQLGLTFIELAKLYRKTKMYRSANDTYDKALHIFEQLQDKENIATVYNESGVVFEYMGNYEEAIKRYRNSLLLKEQLGDTLGIAYAYNFISGVQFLQKKYDSAFSNAHISLHLFQELKDDFSRAMLMGDMARYYLETAKYDSAILYNENSINIAQKLGYKDLLSNNFLIASRIYKNEGKSEEALYFFEQYEKLKDSIFNQETQHTIAELQTQYNVASKERELLDQKNKISRQRILLFSAIAAFLILGLLGFLLYDRNKFEAHKKLQQAIINEQDLSAKAIIRAEESERQRMGASLHDGLGQILSVIKMNVQVLGENISKNELSDKVYQSTLSLVDNAVTEMRSVSHQIIPANALKVGLANALKNLIEHIDSNKLRVHLNVVGLNVNLNQEVQIMLYRIFQESINNVLKHAQATELNIDVINKENAISASISDNGIGFDSSSEIKKGIGLANIQTRINYLKGKMILNAQPGRGTQLNFEIPLSS